MPDLSRSQLLVYAVIAVAVIVIGARWIQSSGSAGAAGSELSFAADSSHEAGESRDVIVHVAGAVGRPGVYRLPAGSRVTDAVRRAGGFAHGASEDAINLAARLSDGQQVVVPGPGAGLAAAQATGGQSGPISLGSATAEQLDGVEGIGPVTAQSIIEFRDQHGGLSSVDQLDEVDGIGPATMRTLRSALQP
ncbi:MAG TPA: helix-hairpin-helix domain-containing protein [Solirubrobacterales bacterium]|nr:helix-hairpin-helix domain-containing protein [Solirubrobacterales bacterium]